MGLNSDLGSCLGAFIDLTISSKVRSPTFSFNALSASSFEIKLSLFSIRSSAL
jgi:hypothetical protein